MAAGALLVLASCTPVATGDSSTTVASTSPTTIPPATASTEPAPAPTPVEPQSGLLLLFGDRLLARSDDGTTTELAADFEIPIRSAFGDGNGGIVYQYSRMVPPFPNDAILHLPASTARPRVLTSADENRRIRLVDVGLFQGLPQILYLETGDGMGRLRALPLAGGSPAELVAGTGIIDGTFAGDLVGIVSRRAGCTEAAVVDATGAEMSTWDCSTGVTDMHLASDGSKVVALAQRDGVTLFDLDDHTNNVSLGNGNLITGLYDYDGAQVAAGSKSELLLLAGGGDTITIDAGPGLRSASLLAVAADLPETAFLGGIRPPDDRCSAEGLAVRPVAQEGLPAPVAFVRTEIVEAATACDYERLVELTAPGFVHSLGPGTSALRTWVQAEQNREDVLGQIVAVLDTPSTTTVDEDGNTLFVWPGAFQNAPTEADWQALIPIYNEEEVDLFREGGYTGMRVIIRADGSWITAVAGE